VLVAMVHKQSGPRKQTQTKEEEEEEEAAAAAEASTDLQKFQASDHFQKHLVNSILLVACLPGCHSSQLSIFHNLVKKQIKPPFCLLSL
jgi:hypothetical protein